ncbi:aminotransferase A [Terrilactibacillus sp. BCM23-1]|uniref:Aminotransferase n=1 Tax=Terrilactibacillus tamarindi TaxID=2599694 RepID=A0A6N8CLQ5_9BACI|nr:aminotransferase A [Terrilactibacillus tamarindi]MTT30914.1 aminotransferase A [Terrilactibacillus tamarindi]
MEHLVNENVKAVQVSGIRRFTQLMAKYPDVLSLTIGQPDFKTPEHVKEAAKAAIDHNHTAYTAMEGVPELREAISQFALKKYHLHYDPESEIIATIGATEALDITFRTFLSPGDEVIIPAPAYPGYAGPIELCGGVPIYVDTTQTDFKITSEQIKKHLSNRTKMVVIPYPCNPTGCVLTKEELDDLVSVLKDEDVIVLSDEIYSELTYGIKHLSIAEYPVMKKKTVVINGLSKSHAMTGWRMGYILSDKDLIKHIIKSHQYAVTCISSITQYAAIEALTNGINDAEPMRQSYEKRLDYVLERLKNMGIDTVRPQGAFYVFPSIKKFNLTSFDFAHQLLEKEHVGVIPGDAFSPLGEGYIRISYAYSLEKLQEGLDRLERFIQTLKK